MSTTGGDELARLRAVLELTKLVDALIEEALRERLPLQAALESILPAVALNMGANAAFVRTFDEELQLRTFSWPDGDSFPDIDEVLLVTGANERESIAFERSGTVVCGQPLDVAGEWFGSVGLAFPAGGVPMGDVDHAQMLLGAFAEEIDNFLHSIRAAREKHNVMLALARALRTPILAKGLAEAVSILYQGIAIQKLMFAYTADEGSAVEGDEIVHLQFYDDGKLVLDTLNAGGGRSDLAAIQEEARRYLTLGDKALAARFGFEGALEEVLVSGAAAQSVVGKVLVSSRKGAFNTYDRDLLGGFSDFICQRVVDFNKEWRTLAGSFRPETVSRLLQTPNYRELLLPREETVAVVFADISGFTRLSEQVLVEPAKIGTLVDTWGAEVVRLTWANGGVFDKMVGDCLIALFGPPFYETTPGERLEAAIKTARGIIDATRTMPDRPGLERLEGAGIGVSIGINLCPLYVGRFGPNENFTGFSAGMNNTARLQHLATKDEILVMEDAIKALRADSGLEFGEERQAPVKNVKEPLRFRPLLPS